MSNADRLIEEYVEEMQNLAEKFMVKTPATKEDIAESPGIKEGDLINRRYPIPNDRNQALELLKNFYGAYEVARLKHKFIHIYHSWSKAAIEAEIHHLETFRSEALKASNTDYTEACRIAYSLDNGKKDNEKFMFLRLYHGFYDNCRDIKAFFFNPWNRIQDYFEHDFLIVKVYGKYFLYYDFLKEKLKSMKEKVEDPYSIRWSSKDHVEFRGQKKCFPFDSYQLVMTLCSLRDRLSDKDVCATDLQNYSRNIFSETELKNYPDLAAWVYNVIETWVQDVQKKHPSHGYPKLFNDLLESCEELAKQAKELPDVNTEVNSLEVKQSDELKGEVLQGEKAENKLNTQDQQEKLSIATYAIMHVYLAKFGGQPVTQQNKNDLVKKYGYSSGDKLRNDFVYYEKEENRLLINITNRRAADTHIEQFQNALKLLESTDHRAFLTAKTDLETLKKEYDRYYI